MNRQVAKIAQNCLTDAESMFGLLAFSVVGEIPMVAKQKRQTALIAGLMFQLAKN